MTGIWSFSDSRWRPEEPVSFRQEKELHDLVEQAPEVLPLAGAANVLIGALFVLALFGAGLWTSKDQSKRRKRLRATSGVQRYPC